MSNYVVCWSDEDHQYWVVIDGYDAMQVQVSELVESGYNAEDVVVGEITKDTE